MHIHYHFFGRFAVLALIIACFYSEGAAQEKIKLDYSSVDASNAVWYTAQEVGFFKKNGLDSELIYIPSTTTAVSSIIAGDIPIGNASGGRRGQCRGGRGELDHSGVYAQYTAL